MSHELLLVEDNQHKKDRIIEFINSLNLRINITIASSFSSGAQAIEQAAFDVVLLDLSLPTYDKSEVEPGGRFRTFGGREIARKILRKNIETKIIFITQYESFSDKGKSYTFENLKNELKKESLENYVDMIHFNSAKSTWKDQLGKSLKEILI